MKIAQALVAASLVSFAFTSLSVSAAPAGPATTKIGAPVKKSKASIDLDCGSKTITLSTGTGGGECTVDGGSATCKDGTNGGMASCKGGCNMTSGSGTCSKK